MLHMWGNNQLLPRGAINITNWTQFILTWNVLTCKYLINFITPEFPLVKSG